MNSTIPLSKSSIRSLLKKRLAELPISRKREASFRLFDTLEPLLSDYQSILSFASFQNEIDLSSLNAFLSKKNKLFLPKMEKEELVIYQVDSLQDLISNNFGVYEPDPEKCSKVFDHEISLILVPGLGFDQSLHRIGYGKGFYDRLLLRFKNSPAIGIGFHEQLIERLPIEPHDISLSNVYFF